MSEGQTQVPGKKKGKGIKMFLFVLLPLLLIGGGVVGCAFMGILNIPGLTPKKKGKALAANSALYTESKAPVEKKPNTKPKIAKQKPVRPAEEASKPDMDQGAKRIAKIWNEIPTEKLLLMLEKWNDEDLARVFSKMDLAKTAEVLAGLPADRASKISESIQLQAAVAAR